MKTTVAVIAIGLVLASPLAARASGARTECYASFGGEAPPRGGRLVKQACAGTCTFDVAVCANAPAAGCAAAPLVSFDVRARPAAGRVPVAGTAPMSADAQCGDVTPIALDASGGRPARRTIRLTAVDTRGRKDRDRLTLVCLPNPTSAGCPPSDGDPVPPGMRECGGVPTPIPPYGRRADLPPSIDTPGTCSAGERASNYLTPESQLDDHSAVELHVIGVYQGQIPDGAPQGFQDHPQGAIDVVVHRRSKPVALFLSSYEPVQWNVALDVDAEVRSVITFGYYDQIVAGLPGGTPVEHLGYADGFDCMYGWEASANEGGCSFWTSIEAIRARTGIVETSFQGCYEGKRFEIPHVDGPPPFCTAAHVPGDESVPNADVSWPGCPDVLAESAHCLTVDGGSLSLLGLDSGRQCAAVSTDAPFGYDSHSIAWHGEILYACGSDGLMRVSLRDGSWESAQLPCNAVSTRGTQIVVMPSLLDPLNHGFGGPLLEYPDYEAILRGAPDLLPSAGLGIERMTVHGDLVYTAWHSTNTIDVGDLVTGQSREPITLDGYDGWILGMAVTDANELVVTGEGALMVFDADTGTRKRTFPTGDFWGPMGLACAVRR
jgi:hypothetical protein